MTDLSDPIAVLKVSPARRVFGAGVQGALGLLLLSVAASLPEPTPWGIVALLVIGVISLVLAVRMYRATARALVLTREGLFDSTGAEIAALSNIKSVDKGFFAFKPSNGFLLRLSEPRPRGWVIGVWWRMGTRVGIGGATSGKAARDLADIIMLLKADPAAGFLPDPD